MSYPGESTVDARVRAVEQEYAARQARLFLRFALIEAPLLAAGIAVYAFVDADLGRAVLAGIAVLGGVILVLLLRKHTKDRAAAVAQARGENPLF
ncbi:hypothetical protein [Microbacterium hydrocarbonoxydans]|uniref:hypothetical protein n=1 Tax=Microbacterium hydrocarbonoxydans TaxID=273678 RepID=UPI0007BB9E6C|nr:hypothetical protein [Microbacterium hydrocarbonoxydans]GAT74752.1 transmembrane protein 160 [Microbacterium sp. HM58-2]